MTLQTGYFGFVLRTYGWRLRNRPCLFEVTGWLYTNHTPAVLLTHANTTEIGTKTSSIGNWNENGHYCTEMEGNESQKPKL